MNDVAVHNPAALTARLHGGDPFLALLGIELAGIVDGRLALEMTVRADHLNFLGGAHGGVLFALADSAFGMAANAKGTVSVGIDTHMAYVQGCREGDRLRAEAEEVSRSRRTAVYRVDVTRGGEPVATFTGTVYLTERALPDGLQAP
ncbi:MAG: hotdog fold thioesterase [Rhodospirillaceae bacterium]